LPPKKPQVGLEPLEAQDRSIKARKSQLFEAEETPEGPTVKPFKAYLETTPPAALSPVVRGVLWTVAGLVLLVFLIAMIHSRGTKPRRRRPATPPAAPKTAAHPASAGGRCLRVEVDKRTPDGRSRFNG
jgi:hypothetical protein